MQKIASQKLLIAVVLLFMSFLVSPKKKIKVYLIGDSTMCMYELNRAPLTGWGMPFTYFFDSSVTIDNRARGGRSTRTFISENRWQPIADSLKEGDYVLIQFGHNDEAKEDKYKDRYTTVLDYKLNLIRFIEDSRRKHANPILITPVTRRKFDKDGNIMETHQEYSVAVYDIAIQYKVPLIDLDKKSRELLQQFGADNSALLFMELKPGENPNYPDGQKDNTHFNEFGARKIAELVLAEIKKLNLELAERIVKP
jgi:lysophospholipase L1-like esterase